MPNISACPAAGATSPRWPPFSGRLGETRGDFDAVASLGGESFLVYLLTDGRIANVLSHNKCAAGSGEFFVQQIGRMGLRIEEAIERSFSGKVVPLAGRCSVHCKSDITHKLNRNEASTEDILHTLHDSMADKVISLLEKGQRQLDRVLVIGGVSRNAAMLAALREKLPATEFVVLPESPCFEAWGCALLTRDDPCYRSPKISPQPVLDSSPPLDRSADRVQVIAPLPRQAPPDGPLVLGVDAGSTTTKAVLLDPATQGVVASHYTRTKSDPVAATRECLRAIARARPATSASDWSGPPARPGSSSGAYLGTAHVYNEISAHATGATHFDPDVDTIFEIGGQDAKYILLRNGVPIDYAMNNACSAGTGSFLEESAQGDLGITVSEIAGAALAAPSPVQFKATCAAFINSDIRIALQQGQSRENIVAGLVYAIAANYLTKVKGPRVVGKKVFLQGGVALNRAVGHAFAHSVDRTVVIPPDPELLGALGVALLALTRSAGRARAGNGPAFPGRAGDEVPGPLHLQGLRHALQHRPFRGGRPAVPLRRALQPVRKCLEKKRPRCRGAGPGRTAGGNDLRHAQRARRERSAIERGRPRIGIPRALSTHSLYPLYSTFLSSLGMDVVLSGVDPRGELKSYSGFCFPAQTAHGAILDLVKQGVDLVFLPHVKRMPQTRPVPRFLSLPDHPGQPLFPCHGISRASAFSRRSWTSPAATNAVPSWRSCSRRSSGYGAKRSRQAWEAAKSAQLEAERAMQELGQQALERALREGKPAVLLAGRSYNAYAPEASQSIGRKLSSMGVTAIPADCLAPIEEGPFAWHFSNQILNAVALAKKHPNLFLVCVSNFSCTVDAFTHAEVASEMGSKPYLILEIDAHTADAGVQTRSRRFSTSFATIRRASRCQSEPFTPCRIGSSNQVVRTNWRDRIHERSARNLLFPQLLRGPYTGPGHGVPLDGPAHGRDRSAGPDPARTGPPVHVGTRVPSAAALHRTTAQDKRVAQARRDRGILYVERRCALRTGRLPGFSQALHRGAAITRPVPVRSHRRERPERNGQNDPRKKFGTNAHRGGPGRGDRARAPRCGRRRQRGPAQAALDRARRNRLGGPAPGRASRIRPAARSASAHPGAAGLSQGTGHGRFLHPLQPVLHGRRPGPLYRSTASS